MSIAANKVHGIRAALGTSLEEVRLARAHNDANVLTLGAKFSTSRGRRVAWWTQFLDTQFEGGRHARRVAKIAAIEGNGANRRRQESMTNQERMARPLAEVDPEVYRGHPATSCIASTRGWN